MPQYNSETTKKSFDPELINLMIQGKCEESLSYIKSHPVREFVNDDGNHLLHVAARYNNCEIIYFLRDSGCQVTVTDSSGKTPFIIAIIHKNFDAAQTLYYGHLDSLRKRLNEPSIERIKATVREDLVSSMRERGLSSEQIGEALGRVISDTPCDVVCHHDAALTKAYLQSTSWEYINVKLDEVFDVVAAKHDLQHVLVILKYAPCDRSKLYEAFCERVLQEYIDYHYESKTAKKFLKDILSLEVFSDVDTLKYLEKKLSNSGSMVVDIFLQYDLHSIVKAKYGRDILACLCGNCTFDRHFMGDYSDNILISLLKDEKIDVDGRGYNGKTPLHFAAQENSIEIVRMLLERGADPNALDEKGRTPFGLAIFTKHCSVDRKCLACVESMLMAGANPLLISERCERTVFTEKYYLDSVHLKIVVHLVVAQLVIFEMLGQYNDESEKLFRIWYDREADIYLNICRVHLAILKCHKIGDSCSELSMFTVVTERPDKLARLLSKEDVDVIFKFVESNEKKLMPFYCQVLKKRADDIDRMQRYRNRAVEVVCWFTGISDPHHLVVNKIVDYFSARDLRIFSKVVVSQPKLTLKDKAKNLLKQIKERIGRF